MKKIDLIIIKLYTNCERNICSKNEDIINLGISD